MKTKILGKSNLVVVQFETSHSNTNYFVTPNFTNNHKTSHCQQHLNKKPNFPLTHQTTKQLSGLFFTFCYLTKYQNITFLCNYNHNFVKRFKNLLNTCKSSPKQYLEYIPINVKIFSITFKMNCVKTNILMHNYLNASRLNYKDIEIIIHFLSFTNDHYFGVVLLLNKVRICGSKKQRLIKIMKFETIVNDL